MKAKASRGRKAAVEEKEGRKGCKRPPREKHRRVADGRGEEGKGEPETVVRANRETVAGGEVKVRPMAKGEEPVPRCAPGDVPGRGEADPGLRGGRGATARGERGGCPAPAPGLGRPSAAATRRSSSVRAAHVGSQGGSGSGTLPDESCRDVGVAAIRLSPTVAGCVLTVYPSYRRLAMGRPPLCRSPVSSRIEGPTTVPMALTKRVIR